MYESVQRSCGATVSFGATDSCSIGLALILLDRLAVPLVCETVITDGQWHRVGLVWDGSTRMLSVDDVVVAEETLTTLLSSDRGLYIGVGANYAPCIFFPGLIDDVRIYNRAVIP